jgi:hypothetical protein
MNFGIRVCGGRGQHARKTPDELRLLGEPIGFDSDDLIRASRLVAKVDSAAVSFEGLLTAVYTKLGRVGACSRIFNTSCIPVPERRIRFLII